jgi:type IV pilus assembly protein PilA
MNFKKMQQGFTLIELMIVVAIIGILAAIAIPAYQDYMIRSKVTESMAAAAACKSSVTEYYQSQGSFPADISAAGCSSVATKYVASLVVTNGVISVTTAADLGNSGANSKVLAMSPITDGTGNLTEWNCKSASGTTIATKYLPALCR